MLAEIGYSQVEGYGGLYNDIEKLRSMLYEYGLTMPTGHFDMDLLRGTGEGYRIAEKLGMEVIICPYILEEERPRDADGWKLFSETLTKTGDRCRQAGFGFAWRNHDFEFEPWAGSANTGTGFVPFISKILHPMGKMPTKMGGQIWVTESLTGRRCIST